MATPEEREARKQALKANKEADAASAEAYELANPRPSNLPDNSREMIQWKNRRDQHVRSQRAARTSASLRKRAAENGKTGDDRPVQKA